MEFLIEEEKKRNQHKQGDNHEGIIPSYNMKSSIGLTALFFTRKSSIVEMLLQLDDIIVEDNLRPLLWRCARHGIVTENVARDKKLRDQFGQINKGTLALEEGEEFCLQPGAVRK